jgi:hypothetical protein
VFLARPAVADRRVTPEAFNNAEWKLDLGAEAEFLPVAVALPGGERLTAVGFVVDEVDQAGLAAVGFEHLVGVGAVTSDDLLLAMGQLGKDLAVVHTGRRGAHGVHELFASTPM